GSRRAAIQAAFPASAVRCAGWAPFARRENSLAALRELAGSAGGGLLTGVAGSGAWSWPGRPAGRSGNCLRAVTSRLGRLVRGGSVCPVSYLWLAGLPRLTG